MDNLKRGVFAALALVATAAPAFGQGVTTASMNGVISDETGEPLAGATVLAVHTPSGSTYGTVTRGDGGYNFQGLRLGGPYTVTVSYVGYRTVQRNVGDLALGQNLTLNLRLVEGEVEGQEVTVLGQGSSILNVDRTGAATNVSTEEIQTLPTISRSLQDFTRLTPQINGGSAAGRNNRFNSIQVDGAVLNDVFGLAANGTPGGQAGTEPISLDAIAEFNVSVAPYDVRENGFTGASINAVTRSGTNRFEGSAYYYGRNESLVGDNRTGASYGDFNDYQTGFRIGGPIVRNKVFFFVNGELGGRTQPVDVGFVGGSNSAIFPVAQDSVAKMYNILKTKYGYDAGNFTPFTDKSDNVKLFGRLDWNLSQTQRFTLRHNFVRAQDDNITRTTSTFAFGNNNYVFNSTQNSTVAQLNSTFSNRFANEARLAYTRVRDNREPLGAAFPQVSVTLQRVDNINRVARAGGETFSNANELDQDVFEFTNNFTAYLGQHTVTAGTSNQFYKFRNLFIRELYGAYTFNSLADLSAGLPATYARSYSLTGDPLQAAEFSAYQLGAYLQDEWKALPGLVLTGGMRIDVPFFPDSPAENATFATAFSGRNTSTVPTGNVLYSPRLGFNWDVNQDRTLQVRGGTGVFSGRTPFVWLSNQYSNTGVEFARLNITSGLAAGFFSADPNKQPTGTAGTTSEVNLTDKGFDQPQTWRSNLAFDYQLPFYGLVATVEGLYSQAVNDLTYADINLAGRQTTASNQLGGRTLFGDPNTTGSTGNRRTVTATSTYFGNPVKVSSAFTNVILLANTDRGFETQLTVGLERRPAKGVYGKLAYTRSRAENVNNLTSSQALSQWRFNPTSGNSNEPDLGTSNFEVRDRVIGALSYRFDGGRSFGVMGLNTTVSVFYNGRAGDPYSYIYAGDANLDNQGSNDLIYIPRDQSEINLINNGGTDTRTAAQIWTELNAFISADSYLDSHRGQIAGRNVKRAPWSNLFDVRFTQELPVSALAPSLRGQRFELTLDVLNAGSLFNSDWGQVRFVPNNTYSLIQFAGYDAAGAPQFRFSTPSAVQGPTRLTGRDAVFSTSDLASRWQMQLGVRYTF